MAYAIPPTGYVSAYDLLALHNDTTRVATSTVKQVVRALNQTVILPDGRVLDLAAGEDTIWIPVEFTQRYLVKSGGAAWMTSINEYIDNQTEGTIEITESNGSTTWTATGRITKPCIEVTPIQPNDGVTIEIELTFLASSDWA